MILFQNKTTRVNKEVKVEEGVESGAENVLVCVEASAVLKAEFYLHQHCQRAHSCRVLLIRVYKMSSQAEK